MSSVSDEKEGKKVSLPAILCCRAKVDDICSFSISNMFLIHMRLWRESYERNDLGEVR